MNFCVEKIWEDDWAPQLAGYAHKAVFNEILPPEYDRIDFALLVVDADKDTAVGYMTCREFSEEDVYLKHGGAFPPIASSVNSMAAYRAALDYLQLDGYKRITTLVENDNTVYLKMALTVGFKPIGIRNFKGSILVELLLGSDY